MAPLPMAAPPRPILPALKRNSTTPIKPLLRSTRTRDEAGLDSTISSPPSPNKRARTVAFSSVIEEQVFSSSVTMAGFAPDGSPRSLETIREEVRFVVEGRAKGAGGNNEAYDALRKVFAPQKTRDGAAGEEASTEQVRMYLLALTSCVTLLGKNCSGLVKGVLDCKWMGRNEAFVKVYVHFLGNLVSAHGAHVGVVLGMLVGKFIGVRSGSGQLADCPQVSRDQLVSRVHMAIKYLLRLVPSASSTLLPIMSAKFPFSDATKKVHMEYIDNLIRIIEYAPELESDIFALITERLVKIDVQMQVDFDDLDDEVAAAIVQAISIQPDHIEDEDDDDDDSDADSVDSDESLDEDTSQVKVVKSHVEKMDAILDRLFSLYNPYFNDPKSISAQSMFSTLLSHFRNIILPTYRSRHTQFLLFHFAQKSEHLIDTFAGECIDLAFKSGRPAILKQSAAAYLASFVSRGAHVPSHVVRDVFDYMGTCLDNIRDENEQSCHGPDLQRYSTFYATTQALLYIFCFRWKDLVVSSDEEMFDEDDPSAFLGQDLEWRHGVKELLSRTIYSKLNPLKICSPLIVDEFARIARKLNFMYVFPLIDANKRVRLSQFALGAGGAGGAFRESTFVSGRRTDGEEETWYQLDAYFPFDPYQLPVSRRWVEGDYVEWKGIPGGLEEEEEDTSDVDEEDEDGGVELNLEEDVDTATDEDGEGD